MASTTVKGFAQIEKTNTQTALNQANTDLLSAQSALSLAQAQLQAIASQIEQFKQKDDQLRAQLRAIVTPSDATQTLKDLSDNIIKMRGAQKRYVDAQRQLDVAQRTLVRVQARTTRAAAADAQAAALLAWATKDNSDNDGWRQAIKQAPLTTLPASANTALTDANGPDKKAAAKLGNDVPAKLLQRAEERGRAIRTQASNARARQRWIEDLADTTIKNQTQSVLSQTRTAYQRSQAAIRDYVSNGASVYKRALDLLQPIPTAPGLTSDETTAVNDPTLATVRSDAADKEHDVATAADALDAAEWELEKAALQALTVDPDANLPQDANWAAKKADRDQKQQDLTAKQTAFTAAMQLTLAQWELAVPDSAWQLVADFLEADASLDSLKNVDPSDQTGLPKALVDAELAYVAALETDSKARRVNQIAQNAIADHADQAAATASAAPAAELSAVRGDA
jgi:hypothetical protein